MLFHYGPRIFLRNLCFFFLIMLFSFGLTSLPCRGIQVSLPYRTEEFRSCLWIQLGIGTAISWHSPNAVSTAFSLLLGDIISPRYLNSSVLYFNYLNTLNYWRKYCFYNFHILFDSPNVRYIIHRGSIIYQRNRRQGKVKYSHILYKWHGNYDYICCQLLMDTTSAFNLYSSKDNYKFKLLSN